MARPKKHPEEELQEIVLPYNIVEINGRKYKQWIDVQGVTFTDPL